MSGGSAQLVLGGYEADRNAGLRRLQRSAYRWLLAAGCSVGILVGALTPAGQSIGASSFALAAAVLIAPALVGSRIWFVVLHRAFFRHHPGLVWQRADGGSALYGGLLLAVVLSIPLLQLAGLPFWTFWDAAAATMLVGLIFTRVGCSLGGCCRGVTTTKWFGLRLPDERGRWERRVPTQLLEAAWAAVALAVVELTAAAQPFAGFAFAAVVGAYGALRLVLERTRAEPVGRTANVIVSTVLMFAAVLVCVVRLT